MEDVPVLVLAELGFARAILLGEFDRGESAADKLFMIKSEWPIASPVFRGTDGSNPAASSGRVGRTIGSCG